MPLDLTGARGELWSAGRWVATLSDVVCHVSPAEALSASGKIARRDAYWLEHGTRFVLRLMIGKRLWQWRDVTVTVAEDLAAIAGQGRPQVT